MAPLDDKSWKRTFYAVWAGQFLSIFGFSFVLPFLPFYIQELGVTDPAAVSKWSGWVFAGAPITLVIFSPVWGVMADRYGRHLMMLRSMLGGALVLWLMAAVQNVEQLMICRLLQGALTGTMTASTVLVAAITPRERAGFALGAIQAAVFIGNSVGPLLGGIMADHLGYRASFMVAGALLLAGAVVVQMAAERDAPPSEEERRAAPSGYGHILTASGFLVGTFVLFAVRFANTSSGPIFPLLVLHLRGSAENIGSVTGAIIACSGIAAAISAGAIGHLGDRVGHRLLLTVCCLFSAVVAGLHALAWNVEQLFVLRTLLGFGAAGMMACATVVVRHSAHDSSIGRAYGLTAGLSSIGMAVGPLTGGYLAAHFDLRAPFVWTAALLAPLAVVVFLLVPKNIHGDDDTVAET